MRLFPRNNPTISKPELGHRLAIVHFNAPELSRITVRRDEQLPLYNVQKVKRSVSGLLILGIVLPVFMIGLVMVDSSSYRPARAEQSVAVTETIQPSNNPATEQVGTQAEAVQAEPTSDIDPNKTIVPQKIFNYSIVYNVTNPSAYAGFEQSTESTLGDSRGWVGASVGFSKVTSLGDFQLILADPDALPTYSELCSTEYSCRVGSKVIINAKFWLSSRPEFGTSVEEYRQMVVNHEVGHWLGLGHVDCPGVGQPAPLMQQQSFGLGGCTPNAWPLKGEIELVKSLLVN